MTAAMVLERRRVASKSRPGVAYEMQRTPAGWEHADEGCEWWLMRNAANQGKPCAHVIELEQETRMATQIEGDPGTAVATYGAAEVVKAGEAYPALVELIDEFDAQLIVRGVDEGIVENWVYGFKQGGEVVKGLSVVGVAAAAREMAKHGEVIRADPPIVTLETDDEIRLVCTAHRFFVAPDGREVEVDSATRALRQLKYQMVNEWVDGQKTGRKIRQDDPKWFEKAYSKAVRNASLPLIRDDCRSAILEAWEATPKAQEVATGGSRQDGGNRGGRQTRSRQAAPQTGGRPAPAPKREPVVEPSMEQLARIEEWRGVLREKHGAAAETAVNTWAAKLWPDAVQERKLRYPLLSPAAADALIMRFRQAMFSPDGDASKHEHDPAFPPDGADWPSCKACGLELRDDAAAEVREGRNEWQRRRSQSWPMCRR